VNGSSEKAKLSLDSPKSNGSGFWEKTVRDISPTKGVQKRAFSLVYVAKKRW
jgi:hypothetical protein